MRGLCLTSAVLVFLCAVGCGKEEVPPESLPQAALIEKVVEPYVPGRPRPTTVTLEFRLTELDRFEWQGKALRLQIVTEGESLLYSISDMPHPGSEVTIRVLLDKKIKDEDVYFMPQWGTSTKGFVKKPEEVTFPNATTRGRAVTVPNTYDRHISQLLHMCGAPGKPVPFDPDKGLTLFKVGYGKDICRFRVWASEASGLD